MYVTLLLPRYLRLVNLCPGVDQHLDNLEMSRPRGHPQRARLLDHEVANLDGSRLSEVRAVLLEERVNDFVVSVLCGDNERGRLLPEIVRLGGQQHALVRLGLAGEQSAQGDLVAVTGSIIDLQGRWKKIK